MFNFKKKKEWVYRISYYTFDSNLYKVKYIDFVNKKDKNLSNTDIFNKYGCFVCLYSPNVDGFQEWTARFYDSFDRFAYLIEETDDKKLVEVKDEDLDIAVENVKDAFKKKFDEFKLDSTLYTRKEWDANQCFRTIAKVKRKLVNESIPSMHRSFILEIEILDGVSAESKREFITFFEFIQEYKKGCAIKVVDSGDKWITKTEEYFD